MSEETDNAWAAGIVDGEGCISIKKSSGGYFQVSVVVGQSGIKTPKLLLKLKRLFGGSFCRAGQWTRRDAKAHRMPKRNWQVVGMDAHKMLLRIEPYLVQKCSEAKLALAFRKYVGMPGKRITENNRIQQNRLFKAITKHKSHSIRKAFYELV